ncbi:protein of unknown function [uncultured Sphingopyxis sp.]|uniref:Uncharacterized protein n=1 Tax=uncultured Sphingopyxis sp. TaxID=310581 RepID=A0A1Y5PYE5_9SPHN|nr:protein of unknown function [uncultured Sphingopyxis sp.]
MRKKRYSDSISVLKKLCFSRFVTEYFGERRHDIGRRCHRAAHSYEVSRSDTLGLLRSHGTPPLGGLIELTNFMKQDLCHAC